MGYLRMFNYKLEKSELFQEGFGGRRLVQHKKENTTTSCIKLLRQRHIAETIITLHRVHNALSLQKSNAVTSLTGKYAYLPDTEAELC
jgi:hypothetical protein